MPCAFVLPGVDFAALGKCLFCRVPEIRRTAKSWHTAFAQFPVVHAPPAPAPARPRGRPLHARRRRLPHAPRGLRHLLRQARRRAQAQAHPAVEPPPAVEPHVPAARPTPTVDRLGRPLGLGTIEPELHVPEPRGFLGIPPGRPLWSRRSRPLTSGTEAKRAGVGGGDGGGNVSLRRMLQTRQCTETPVEISMSLSVSV